MKRTLITRDMRKSTVEQRMRAVMVSLWRPDEEDASGVVRGVKSVSIRETEKRGKRTARILDRHSDVA